MDFFYELAAAGGVLVLATVSTGFLRRRGWTTWHVAGRSKIAKVTERVALSQHVSLQVVQVRESEYVLLIHPAGGTVIACGPAPAEIEKS